jgi:hypothetical protein
MAGAAQKLRTVFENCQALSHPLLHDGHMKSHPGPPMTLGNAAAARVRLIVRCKACSH